MTRYKAYTVEVSSDDADGYMPAGEHHAEVRLYLAADVEALLLKLRRGGECWCEKGIGNPMMPSHSEACREASTVFAHFKELP